MARNHLTRSRWAAFGAAVAVTLGGGITLVAQAAGSGTASSYTPITPCRLMDTRPAPFNVGPRTTPIGQGENHPVVVHGTNGNCTIPANATGIATNTTVVNGTAASFLTLFPADANRPNASNLNWLANQAPTPNQVTVGLSPDGRLRVYNDQGNVDVIIDVVGIYTSAGPGVPGPAGPAGPPGPAGPAGPAGPGFTEVIPFSLVMDFGETATIVERGDSRVFARCSTDGATDRVEIVATSTAEGWRSVGLAGSRPADSEVVWTNNPSEAGVPRYSQNIDRGHMMSPDGSYLAFQQEMTTVALNVFGRDCIVAGLALSMAVDLGNTPE